LDEDQTLNSLNYQKRNSTSEGKIEKLQKSSNNPIISTHRSKGNVIYRKIKAPLNQTHNFVEKARKNQFMKNIKSFPFTN
jgi:hypothetical protein